MNCNIKTPASLGATEGKTMKVWYCKIGVTGDLITPKNADLPMRAAIEKAFIDITGQDAEFTFSGWGGELEESELAVVEDREPDIDVQIQELHKHEEIVQSGVHYHNGT